MLLIQTLVEVSVMGVRVRFRLLGRQDNAGNMLEAVS